MLVRITAQIGIILMLGIIGSVSARAGTIAGFFGLDAGFACLDGAVSCAGERDFDVVGVSPATGTVDLTGGPLFYSVDITLAVSDMAMEDTSGAVDGVDRIEFTSLAFEVTGWSGADFLASGTVSAMGVAMGTVAGTYEQFDGASSVGGPTVFSEPINFENFICDASGTGLCGFEVGFFNNVNFPGLLLPVGVTSGGTDHQFDWVFNVTLIPEPSTVTLLVIGLVGLSVMGRRGGSL